MPNIIETLRDTYAVDKAAALNMLLELFRQYDNGTILELPCQIGSTVWVSPNHGKSFHTGKLYGTNKYGAPYLVFVDDKKRDFVENPLGRCFYDWFSKVYTRAEAEQALKEGEKR